MDEDQPDKLSVIKLIILGLVLCGGSYELKARVLYDVLQDNMQQQISSSDKDFKSTFRTMVIMTCYLMLQIYREESGAEYITKHYPQPGSLEFENLVDELLEDFLDAIYGDESMLRRGDFISKVYEE